MKAYKLLFVLLASAVFSTAVLADGIDPQVIIKPGGGSTPITLTTPNPMVSTPAALNTGQCTDPSAPACVFDVFQNQTGSTITSLTIFIPTFGNLIFSCGDAASLSFFNSCSTSNIAGGTDVFFSNSIGSPFSGVATATKSCDDDEEEFLSFSSESDDCKFVGGEFAVDIEGAGITANDIHTPFPLTVITTPEPAAALLMLFGALAFGLLAVGRRFV